MVSGKIVAVTILPAPQEKDRKKKNKLAEVDYYEVDENLPLLNIFVRKGILSLYPRKRGLKVTPKKYDIATRLTRPKIIKKFLITGLSVSLDIFTVSLFLKPLESRDTTAKKRQKSIQIAFIVQYQHIDDA